MRFLAQFFLFAACTVAGEWRQFRGPNGSGVASEGGLPVAMGGNENLGWKVAAPAGYTSPVVTRERVFLTGHTGQTLVTVCLDRATGKELWRREAPKPWPSKPRGPASPAMSSPATDGRNVYVAWQHSGLLSYDSDGEERWRVDLGTLRTPYGFGSSPVLAGDSLLLQVDQDSGSYLLAVHKDTGQVLWKTPRPEATHSFPSPVLYAPKGKPKQVIVSGAFQVAGYSLATGEKLWWVDGMSWQPKSMPLVDGDTIFVHSSMPSMDELGGAPKERTFAELLARLDADKDGKIVKDEAPSEGEYSMKALWFLYDLDADGVFTQREFEVFRARFDATSGVYAMRAGERGDVTKTNILWTYVKGLPNLPSPILAGGALFLIREGGILTSLDPATGKVAKQGRVEGAIGEYVASPVSGDGKLYLLSKDGKLAVVKAARDWEVLHVNSLDEDCWGTPAIADGEIFVKTQQSVWCFRAKKS